MDTEFKFMAVPLQTAKCYHNQGRHSLGQGDTWKSGIATVTEKEVCIPFFMQLDQLWLCLMGIMLSVYHFSTLDKEMLLGQMLEFHGILSRSKVPWNSMELSPYSRVPWNSMKVHGTFNFPQKSSMEFHGIPQNFFEVPWNSMELDKFDI